VPGVLTVILQSLRIQFIFRRELKLHVSFFLLLTIMLNFLNKKQQPTTNCKHFFCIHTYIHIYIHTYIYTFIHTYITMNGSIHCLCIHDVIICGSVQGTHQSLKNDQQAKSIVTGIINGTGTFGAALGPLIVGVVSDKLVSNFYMC